MRLREDKWQSCGNEYVKRNARGLEKEFNGTNVSARSNKEDRIKNNNIKEVALVLHQQDERE